jgi:hypothetical protein
VTICDDGELASFDTLMADDVYDVGEKRDRIFFDNDNTKKMEEYNNSLSSFGENYDIADDYVELEEYCWILYERAENMIDDKV